MAVNLTSTVVYWLGFNSPLVLNNSNSSGNYALFNGVTLH